MAATVEAPLEPGESAAGDGAAASKGQRRWKARNPVGRAIAPVMATIRSSSSAAATTASAKAWV